MLGVFGVFGQSHPNNSNALHKILERRLGVQHMNINMNGIRRTCQSAFRSWITVCLRANGSQRAFSRSCPRPRSSLPVFLEPSSPELASLLKVANSKLLLPYHLTKEQQKLVYRQANKTRLEADPIDITIGDVTLPLEHIDRNHLPNRRQTLKDIVLKSETRDDWENVIRLLEGFRDASVTIKPQWREYIVRHLFESGNQHLALKALQRPKATGFSLSDRLLLKTIVRGIHNKAAEADWAKEETIKSLRYAKQVIDLMEDEEHSGGKIIPAGRIGDWRGAPWVVALPTILDAKLAEKHGGDKEEVSKLSKRLVNTLKQDTELVRSSFLLLYIRSIVLIHCSGARA